MTFCSPGAVVLVRSLGSAVPAVVQESLRTAVMETVQAEESKPPEPPSDETPP